MPAPAQTEEFTDADFGSTNADSEFTEDDFLPKKIGPGTAITSLPKSAQDQIQAQLQLAQSGDAGMRAGTEGSESAARGIQEAMQHPVQTLKALPGGVLNTAMAIPMGLGKLAYLGAADLVSKIAGQPEYGGNLAAMTGEYQEQLPVDKFLASVAKTTPDVGPELIAAKTLAQGPGIVASSGFGLAGLAGKLLAAGFSADMISKAPQLARDLGTELGKNPGQRDQDKMTSLISEAIQTGVFAPMAGFHASRDTIMRYADKPHYMAEQIAKQLDEADLNPDDTGAGLPQPTGLRAPLAARGIPQPQIQPTAEQVRGGAPTQVQGPDIMQGPQIPPGGLPIKRPSQLAPEVIGQYPPANPRLEFPPGAFLPPAPKVDPLTGQIIGEFRPSGEPMGAATRGLTPPEIAAGFAQPIRPDISAVSIPKPEGGAFPKYKVPFSPISAIAGDVTAPNLPEALKPQPVSTPLRTAEEIRLEKERARPIPENYSFPESERGLANKIIPQGPEEEVPFDERIKMFTVANAPKNAFSLNVEGGGYAHFEPGEGKRWQVTVYDESGNVVEEDEAAFLRTLMRQTHKGHPLDLNSYEDPGVDNPPEKAPEELPEYKSTLPDQARVEAQTLMGKLSSLLKKGDAHPALGRLREIAAKLGIVMEEPDPGPWDFAKAREYQRIAAQTMGEIENKFGKQKGQQYASGEQQAAEVHGDVRPQPREGEGKVPAEEGGGGIQPQAEPGVSREGQAKRKVSLKKPPGFFDVQSEAQGLGRQSGAPSLEDIRAQRAQEARESQQAPPVEPGKVRLYHGEGGPEGSGAGGSFFTDSAQRARSYGPNVSYVDVPPDVADAAHKMAQREGQPTTGDALLPTEWVKQSKPHPAVEQAVHDLDQPPKGPSLEESVRAKLADIKPEVLLKLAPDQFTNWKRMSKYGPEVSKKVAAKMTPEMVDSFEKERDRLADEFPKELTKVKSADDNAQMLKANKISLKLQTINEILKDWHQQNDVLGPAEEYKEPAAYSGLPLDYLDNFYEKDLKPLAKGLKGVAVAGPKLLVKLFSPESLANPKDVDLLFEAKGDREKFLTQAAAALDSVGQKFAKMPEKGRIAFIDRVKTGQKQPTPELQHAADLIRVWDDRLYEAATKYKPGLNYRDNHLRVLWKVIPGSDEAKANMLKAGITAEQIASKRPWRGSQGFLRKATLHDMSEGIAMGGVPVTTDPMEMFMLHAQDVTKFVAANAAFEPMKKTGSAQFVQKGSNPPPAFIKLEDSIAKAYFRTPEGLMTSNGEWWVNEGTARMINNYLSRDYIRQGSQAHPEFGVLGRGALALKNATTAIELGLSPFHAVFETFENMGSTIGLGLRKIQAGRGLEGFTDVAKGFLTEPAGVVQALGMKAPRGTTAGLGDIVRRYATNEAEFRKADPETYDWFIKNYPHAKTLIDDLFTGGGQISMNEDYRIRGINGFKKALAEKNPIGAAWRSIPALNELALKPLFQTYIPRLKLGTFLKEYSFELEQRQADLQSGRVTRSQIARQVWRFVEDRFGELNFDNLYWDRTLKSSMQLTFRSVTWKLGNIEGFGKAGRDVLQQLSKPARYLASGPLKQLGTSNRFTLNKALKDAAAELGQKWQDEGYTPKMTLPMSWLLGMSVVTGVAGSIISKIFTGKYPWETAKNPGELARDLIFPRIDAADASQRVSIPTYWKDAVHAAHDPVDYVKSSMTGEAGRLWDTWNNRDFYGVEVYNPDDPLYQKSIDVAKHLIPQPFGLSSYTAAKRTGASGVRALAGFSGFTKAPYYMSYTPAELKINEIIRGKQTIAPKTKETFERGVKERIAVDAIKRKEMTIHDAIKQGLVLERRRENVLDRVHASHLVYGISSSEVTPGEAMKVYDLASPEEKKAIRSIIREKILNSKVLTGPERRDLFKRLRADQTSASPPASAPIPAMTSGVVR